MRAIFFENAASLQDVEAKVLDRRSADPAASLKRIKELNPHVDLNRLKAGTVLILPTEPGIKSSGKDVDHFGGEALREFAAAVAAGFEEAAARVRKTADAAASNQKAVAESLKGKIVKRQFDSDIILRKQIDAAGAAMADRQKAVKEATLNVDALAKFFAEEVAAMNKVLR
jgi:hypothetical protein